MATGSFWWLLVLRIYLFYRSCNEDCGNVTNGIVITVWFAGKDKEYTLLSYSNCFI
jgi:hypothetical protein